MRKQGQTDRNHVHRLKRTKYKNGTAVYFCVLNCSHKIEVEFALGKQTLCNICGEEFTMNEYSIRLAKPHCNRCGKHKVTNSDGTYRFEQKGRPTPALAEVRTSSASLRDRLSRVVAIAQDEEL